MAREMATWLADTEWIGLILPDGWFGRPYDNRHHVTRCVAEQDRLIVEIDQQQVLTIENPAAMETTPTDLVITGFSQLRFDWTGYGSRGATHSLTYSGGALTLKSHRAFLPA
jgi:hypothetical protein